MLRQIERASERAKQKGLLFSGCSHLSSYVSQAFIQNLALFLTGYFKVGVCLPTPANCSDAHQIVEAETSNLTAFFL
jgi:hypothetical protein